MNIFGYTLGKKERLTWAQMAEKAVMQTSKDIKASFYGGSYPIIETTFDGEKTQGELGAPLSYLPDYNALSYRSWQAFTESDLAQIIIKAHVNWVIGSGLKLQSEPFEDIINSEGFNFNREEFIKTTEQRFRLFAKTNNSVHNGMYNFNKAQRIASLNAMVGGDVLWIQRLENGLPTIQLIDGVFVQTPNIDEINKAEARGNKIIHGVEVGKNNEHIRFFVANQDGSFTTIEAKGKNTGKLQAKLIYASEYRIDGVRGMPILSAVLEKMKKLDRYGEAVVAGAEERAKIPYFFEHNRDSDGTNPDLAKLANVMAGEETVTDEAVVVDMTEQTKIFKRTFEKEPINLPVGSQLKALAAAMETEQELFTTGNFIYICAAVEIPYEVALMKYVNSFSSSRMASQTWLTLLKIKRVGFNDDFTKPFYNLFLDSQILSGKIKADGYFSAQNKGDVILLEAYRNCRFTGPGVPQADPSKEVKAEISKIDNNLTTHEQAMEVLGNGEDFDTVVNKLAKEKNKIKELIPEEQTEANNKGGD